jgi:hypothetical protein
MSLVREHRTGRLHTLNVPLAANTGCPTGGDSYGHGPPTVVRDGSAVHKAKGQSSKGGQSLPVVPGGRGGIAQLPSMEGCEMQSAEVRRISGGE